MPDTPPVRIAHLSDTHLGYEAYRAVTADGHNQRGQDFIDAFHAVCNDIDTWDPPLVIHSGDVIDRPQVPVRYLKAITDGFARLASIRPDGTRRQVIVIEGNHDAPHSTREIAAVELLRRLPGVHVASTDTVTIHFTTENHPDVPHELDNVTVTAVPHDDLHHTRARHTWGNLTPNRDAKHHILTAHGIAGGSDLYQRGIGRELAIPTPLLNEPWSYVALGHWHLRGPVGHNNRIWYAGSTENCGFGDLKDNGHLRGWLAVTLNDTPDTPPTVEPRNTPIRRLRQLEPIHAEALSGQQITDLLIERINQAHQEHPIDGHVLNQTIQGARRHTWNLVDTQTARRHATNALHYQITLIPQSDTHDTTNGTGGDQTTPPDQHTSGTLGIDTALEQAATRLPGRRRKNALQRARQAIADERHKRETSGRTGSQKREPKDATAVHP